MNIKKAMKYDVAHPGPGMGQAQRCGGVKLITGSPIYKLYIYKLTIA